MADKKKYIECGALIKDIEENQRNTEHHKDGRGKQIHVGEHRHFIRMVHEQPAADVAPVVHGEWEWFEEWSPSTPDHPKECDECGWRCGKCKTALEDVVGGYWDDSWEKPKLKHCPECGAKMDGGKEQT